MTRPSEHHLHCQPRHSTDDCIQIGLWERNVPVKPDICESLVRFWGTGGEEVGGRGVAASLSASALTYEYVYTLLHHFSATSPTPESHLIKPVLLKALWDLLVACGAICLAFLYVTGYAKWLSWDNHHFHLSRPCSRASSKILIALSSFVPPIALSKFK